MGSIKKRRKAKINKHKRRKKLRLNRQEAHLAEVIRPVRFIHLFAGGAFPVPSANRLCRIAHIFHR